MDFYLNLVACNTRDKDKRGEKLKDKEQNLL